MICKLRWFGLPLGALMLLSAASLAWGSYHALTNSADLMRRVEEVRLVLARENPYQDPDATYPPASMPLFTVLIGPLAASDTLVRATWLGLNLAAAGLVVALSLRGWATGWSPWQRLVFAAVALASKPVRLTLGMGQYSLLPLASMLGALALIERGRVVSAAVLMVLALAKPTMSLPFAGMLLLWNPQARKACAGACVILGVLHLSLAGWLGRGSVSLLHDWLARARTQDAAGLVDIPSMLVRWTPELHVGALPVSLVVLALGWAAMVALRSRAEPRELAVLAFYVAAVFTYHRPYDLVLLIPGFATVIQRGRRYRIWAWPTVAYALLLLAPAERGFVPPQLYETAVATLVYLFLAGQLVAMAARPRSPALASTSDSNVPDEAQRAEKRPGS